MNHFLYHAGNDRVLWLVGGILLAVTAILVLGSLVALFTARRDAAARHTTWLAALMGVLLVPCIVIALDRIDLTWHIRVFPAPVVDTVTPAPNQATSKSTPASTVSAADGTIASNASISAPTSDSAEAVRSRAALSLRGRELAAAGLIVWAFGTVLLVARLLGGMVILARFRARCQPLKNTETNRLLTEITRRLGLAARPGLLVCDDRESPIAIGILRPAIVLPSSFENSDASREILIHEAAHLLRRDPLVGLLQRVVAALFWPHPLIAVLNRGLARAREEVCDNYVLRYGDRFRYSRTLVELQSSFDTGPRSLAAVALFSFRWDLSDRIAGLLDERRIVMLQARPLRKIGTSVLLLTIGMTLGSLRLAAAVAPGDSSPVPTQDTKASDENQVTPAGAGPVTENEIAGRVIDADGKPLEGVLVDAWSWYPGHETHTDKAGIFRLQAFTGPGYDPREGAEMKFSKQGHCPKTFPHGAIKGGTADLVVTLTNKTYFEGVTLDPNGKPVPNALIRASNPSKDAEGREVGKYWTETRTKDDGSYRLYVEPSIFDIQVRLPGIGVARRTGETISENEGKKIDLTLAKGVEFRAKVVDSQTGQPVPGLRVWNWQQPEIEGRADAEGIIRLDDMLPGRVEFQVGDDRVGETERHPESHGITRWWSEQCISKWNRKTIEEARGGSGKWQRNFDDLDFELKVGLKPVTIVVEKGVWIRGRVLDPEGKPVAGATVAPALTGTGNSLTGDTRFSVESGPDGKYEMLLPASGEHDYNLVAHDGGYLEWRNWANGVLPPFRTKPGEVRENVDISLTRPATVKGRVVGADGKPVANREVRASAADKLENRYYDPTTERTDAEGRFELKFIRPGKQHIQVAPFWLSADDAPGGTSQTVELKAGEIKEGVELTAQPDPDRAPETGPEVAARLGVPIADDPDTQIKDAGEDARNIQGTWIVTDLKQIGGTPGPEVRESLTNGTPLKIRITADKIRFFVDNSEMEYRLNPTKSPKVISLILAGRVIAKGIYELNGDDLVLCQNQVIEMKGGQPQPPTNFDLSNASPGALVMKREKASSEPKN